MEGPEFYSLSSESRVNIFASSFTVSNDSSRMGNRLDGTRMELFDSEHMVTAPVNLGTIQCPKNGLPIILGCDSQTLGGYPRILQIAEVDFPIIGQLRPHDKVSFVRVSIEEARDKLKQLELIHPF
jgi:antagonist of KipI